MNRLYAAALCLVLASGCGDKKGATSSGDPGELKHPPNEATFLSGATFIAGDGSAPIEEATVILDGDTIFQVGKKGELQSPKGALSRPGLEGHYIIPMMVNLSAYPGLSNAGDFNANNYKLESLMGDLNRYAYYGVAAVVAGGDTNGLAFQVRAEEKAGKSTGAMLFTSGRGIAAKGASGMLGSIPSLVSSEADAQKAVGELAELKADVIVLWANGMKPATAAAVVDEAHKRKLKVFADAPALSEAKNLVKAGVDGLIGSVREDAVDDELVSMMKDKKIPLAPALSSLEAQFIYPESPRWVGEQPMIEVYPPKLSAFLKDPVVLDKMKRSAATPRYKAEFETASKNLKKLADGGVTIAFGSGSGSTNTFPGYFEHHELELMAAAGMSAADVLKAASLSSAAALGATDLGALTPGKKANFMIISDDPLKDIKATRYIDEVWINGKQADRQELVRKYPIEVKGVSKDDIATYQKNQQQDLIAAIEAKETHYGNGKFVLAKPATSVTTGLSVQTPRHGSVSKSGGPPWKVSVSFPGAAAADLQAFYKETLKGWTSSGNCYDKAVPGDESKKFHLCTEASAGQITLNINIQ